MRNPLRRTLCSVAAAVSMSAQRSAPPRVLSIQSHVVHGCVGNRAATLPLQLLGVETDVLNTVQYSNHVGYGSFAGEKLSGEQVWALLQGMHTNGLLAPDRLLTGYMGSAEAVRAVVKALPLLREARPDFQYWCDPVLGDNGRLYVPPALVDTYREEVVPYAHALLPNQFEAELLRCARGTRGTRARGWVPCAPRARVHELPAPQHLTMSTPAHVALCAGSSHRARTLCQHNERDSCLRALPTCGWQRRDHPHSRGRAACVRGAPPEECQPRHDHLGRDGSHSTRRLVRSGARLAGQPLGGQCRRLVPRIDEATADGAALAATACLLVAPRLCRPSTTGTPQPTIESHLRMAPWRRRTRAACAQPEATRTRPRSPSHARAPSHVRAQPRCDY